MRFDFEGDLFEMEDQRNWTDGSFKTYSTPLALLLAEGGEPGQAIRQRVMMRRCPARRGSGPTADSAR